MKRVSLTLPGRSHRLMIDIPETLDEVSQSAISTKPARPGMAYARVSSDRGIWTHVGNMSVSELRQFAADIMWAAKTREV